MPDETTPVIETTAPKPAARIVDRSKIEDTVTLDYPVEFDGVVWDKIKVRHPTTRDMADFAARYEAAGERGHSLRLPMYDAPDEVMDALLVDDSDKLNEAALRFLPRRFRAEPANASA